MKYIVLCLALCVAAVGQDTPFCGIITDHERIEIPCINQFHPFTMTTIDPPTLWPMNVPAVKNPHRFGDYMNYEAQNEYMDCRVWTCPDESWELHTSVNGKLHWCSRPPVMEGKP